MRLMYHWLTGMPGEPGITRRVDRLFSPAVTTMHFSPHPPAQAEAQVRAESPARAEARADVPAIQPVQEPARQAADRAGTQRLEIPLPEHPNPQHPPIYYRMDSESGRPIPEEYSVIDQFYVHDRHQSPAFFMRYLSLAVKPMASRNGFSVVLRVARFTIHWH